MPNLVQAAIEGPQNLRGAQEFLANKIEQVVTPENLERMAYFRAHPVLGAVDAVSKATGGPGLTEGFKDGVIDDRAYGRGGSYNINVPPMPF